MLVAVALGAALLALATVLARAQDRSATDLPRFASIKERASEMRLRTGPGLRYPIDWVFTRPGWPVEVLARYDTWRQVRDHEGTVGWVHQSMLSARRTVIVQGGSQRLRREPSELAPVLATAERGVIAELAGCEDGWCRIAAQGVRGWVRRASLWGLYPAEQLP